MKRPYIVTPIMARAEQEKHIKDTAQKLLNEAVSIINNCLKLNYNGVRIVVAVPWTNNQKVLDIVIPELRAAYNDAGWDIKIEKRMGVDTDISINIILKEKT